MTLLSLHFHIAVCFFFLWRQKNAKIPSPLSCKDNSQQKLPDSSATSCFIAYCKPLYYTLFQNIFQEFFAKNFIFYLKFFYYKNIQQKNESLVFQRLSFFCYDTIPSVSFLSISTTKKYLRLQTNEQKDLHQSCFPPRSIPHKLSPSKSACHPLCPF